MKKTTTVKIRYNHWIPKVLGVSAITLYPYILIKFPREPHFPRVLKHEMQHVRQVREIGWWKFYFSYLWEWFKNLLEHRNHKSAYVFIPYEVEAYKLEVEKFTDAEREELHRAGEDWV